MKNVLILTLVLLMMTFSSGFSTSATTLLTSTPIGTLPPNPIAVTRTPNVNQIERYEMALAELRSTLGFDHPELEKMAGAFAISSVSEFHMQVARVDFNQMHYVALLTPTQDADHFSLFQVMDGNPYFVELPSGIFRRAFVRGIEQFADRNGNNLPDLVLTNSFGGNCCPTFIILIEITSNGEIINITPDMEDVALVEFVDLDDDGILEIRGYWGYFAPGSQSAQSEKLPLIRWFGWDGTAYVDISAEQSDYYEAEIDELREQLSPRGRCYYNSIRFRIIYQILLDYHAMGRLQEGWEELQPVMNLDDCPPSSEVDQLTDIFAIYERMVETDQIAVP